MHNEDEILNEIVETAVAEGVPLYVAPKRGTAFKTALAYWKTMRAAAVAVFPALAVSLSGQTTISQEQPVRKPEEHLASEAESGEATFESERFEVALTSDSSLVSWVYLDGKTRGGNFLYKTFQRKDNNPK